MFHVLIDTSVWLDLGKDYHQRPLLEALEALLKDKRISLILPRIVVKEFDSNKERVMKAGSQGLASNFKRVKDAVHKFGDPKDKAKLIQQLNELDHKIGIGEATDVSFDRIEAIFRKIPVVEVSDEVKLRAAQRALDKKAPFHHGGQGKNSMADAVLIEMYADLLRTRKGVGQRFAFVTHNKDDFSHLGGNAKLPHPDLEPLFSKIKSLYFLSLKDALQRMKPALLSELIFVQEWIEEPRRLSEIVDAIDELMTKVWYNRHQVRKEKIEDGVIKIVEQEDYSKGVPREEITIQKNIWEGALRSALKVEERFGLENLGPWDDFEWGMLNGKLSALRWVLGEDWDELYT